EVMNAAYTLNASPSSAFNNWRFPIRCTTRKRIRNKPVSAITYFLPMLLEKKFENQFILVKLSLKSAPKILLTVLLNNGAIYLNKFQISLSPVNIPHNKTRIWLREYRS